MWLYGCVLAIRAEMEYDRIEVDVEREREGGKRRDVDGMCEGTYVYF